MLSGLYVTSYFTCLGDRAGCCLPEKLYWRLLKSTGEYSRAQESKSRGKLAL